MPELPEVENVVKGLRNTIVNKKVTNVKVLKRILRKEVNTSFENDIKGTVILSVNRRAKYIMIELSNDKSILMHLGMTGQLTVENSVDNLKKHSHIIIELDNGKFLVYNDVRRFGLALSMDSNLINKHELINHIGIEPLEKEFNGNKLYELLKGRKSNIKISLLNQSIVCGIGNIYACEALFYSGINPERSADSLSIKECNLLAEEVKKILLKSIDAGGSTLKDYRKSDGSKGSFQDSFAVYGRAGQDCISCSSKIEQIKQSGRSTFYCPKCQK